MPFLVSGANTRTKQPIPQERETIAENDIFSCVPFTQAFGKMCTGCFTDSSSVIGGAVQREYEFVIRVISNTIQQRRANALKMINVRETVITDTHLFYQVIIFYAFTKLYNI